MSTEKKESMFLATTSLSVIQVLVVRRRIICQWGFYLALPSCSCIHVCMVRLWKWL